uniref:Uncharacterized protein n=1 Tax=Fagus sylvatica TaxID=28930 RepID=A0A2N9HAV8_FAGSY
MSLPRRKTKEATGLEDEGGGKGDATAGVGRQRPRRRHDWGWKVKAMPQLGSEGEGDAMTEDKINATA